MIFTHALAGVSRRLVATSLLALLALALGAAPVRAQSPAEAFPTKPVRLVVGYPPGGLPDTTARVMAQRLSEALGQQFVVENKPGAGGSLACELVAKAAPDGYTLLIADLGQAALNMALYPNLPYDTLRDFAPISMLGTSPFFLAVHAGAGIGSYQDLAAQARTRPGAISYGSSGNGSPPHLAMEMLKSSAGLDLMHVPFKGSGQSLPALVSGQVQLLFTVLPTVAGAVKSGSVKLLAVASESRTSQAQDVPTFAELGVKGMLMLPSVSLLAPAGTPKAIVSQLGAEVGRAVRHPETLKRFAALGIEPVGDTPEAYAAKLRADVAFYGKAVRQTGARID